MKRLPRSSTPEPPVNAEDGVTLHHVLGYQLAQAAIVTFGVFDPVVRTALDLRPVEYTILMLIKENPGISPAKLASWLGVDATEHLAVRRQA